MIKVVPPSSPTAADPAATVEALARTARKHRTPCGEGTMVWRGWGAGEPLVLFHGGTGSWTHWLRTIPALSQHFELWVPDIPGLGDSAMPPEPRTPASCAGAAVAGLGALLPGGRPLRVVGFSFGGHVAGLVAARLGEQVRTLTLVGVASLGLHANPREPLRKERTGMTTAELMAVHRHNLGALMIADPTNIDALAVYLQAENVKRARFRSRPFALTDELARTLEQVPASLSTIWGTRDPIGQPSLETRLDILRRYHPEMQVRLVDGAGHWVMYEAADRFNAALLDLLRGAEAGRG